MYESGNALRGIFLTAFVALLLFSSFIFCFHLERPDAMTVEPEMTGYYFYHPDIAVFHPSENNAALTAKDPTAAGSTAGSTSANSMAASSTATGSTDASPGEWWVNFSTLGCSCHPVSVLPVSVLQNTKAICDFIIIRKEDSI